MIISEALKKPKNNEPIPVLQNNKGYDLEIVMKTVKVVKLSPSIFKPSFKCSFMLIHLQINKKPTD